MLVEEAVCGGLKVDEGAEDGAFEAPFDGLGEEALDGVQPRARGRHEVEGEARMAIEPGARLGMPVGGVVVEDHVDELAGPAHDLVGADPIGAEQHDPGAPDVLLGALRSRTTAFRRRRSVGVTMSEMPGRIAQTRKRRARPESPAGFKCQVLSTSRLLKKSPRLCFEGRLVAVVV